MPNATNNISSEQVIGQMSDQIAELAYKNSSLVAERDRLMVDLAEVNEKNEKLFNHTTRLSKKLREEQNLNDGLIKQLKEKRDEL